MSLMKPRRNMNIVRDSYQVLRYEDRRQERKQKAARTMFWFASGSYPVDNAQSVAARLSLYPFHRAEERRKRWQDYLWKTIWEVQESRKVLAKLLNDHDEWEEKGDGRN